MDRRKKHAKRSRSKSQEFKPFQGVAHRLGGGPPPAPPMPSPPTGGNDPGSSASTGLPGTESDGGGIDPGQGRILPTLSVASSDDDAPDDDDADFDLTSAQGGINLGTSFCLADFLPDAVVSSSMFPPESIAHHRVSGSQLDERVMKFLQQAVAKDALNQANEVLGHPRADNLSGAIHTALCAQVITGRQAKYLRYINREANTAKHTG